MSSGCSTTKPVVAEEPVVEPPKAVAKKVEPTLNLAVACPEVRVQEGVTNEGLAKAFKAQRDLHRECVKTVQREIARLNAKPVEVAPAPAAPAAPTEPAKQVTPVCRWWVGLTGEGC